MEVGGWRMEDGDLHVAVASPRQLSHRLAQLAVRPGGGGVEGGGGGGGVEEVVVVVEEWVEVVVMMGPSDLEE